jgi:hypothetical protein
MRRAFLSGATVLSLAACGAAGGRRPASPVAIAQRTHEYPSPNPPPQTATSGSASAAAAVRAFATAYINWSADTVATDMRKLAAQSIGQARSAMQLAAAGTASDYELQQAGISNSGTVEAVAPLSGSRDEYVVVTREATAATSTTAYQGLRPAWHVTVATVSRAGTGVWVVSGWKPEV